MDFVFAIPTYNRPNEQLTVEYLSSCGVDKDLIYCFVQTKEDEIKIKKKYGNLCNVVFGKANSHSSNCNNVFSYFDEGTKIVLIDDDRYTSLFRGQKNWNCKFSIITNDDDAASKIEVGVPSSTERIEAIRKFSELEAGGATLRLRPFIIGVTSRNYLELIERAHDAGATAVTTEFLCIENRAAHIPEIKKHYDVLSEECGFDILKFYNKYSYGSGYLRLNRKIKEPYIKKMQELCKKLGMRFYVSDAHFKEACDGSCCCGLPESWNYSRGNFSYALQLCKKNGSVRFSEIRKDLGFLENVEFNKAEAFNTGSSERRAKFEDMTLVDYLRYLLNNPNAGQSPCKMFEKVMYPDGYDENGDIIYRYNKDVTYVR